MRKFLHCRSQIRRPVRLICSPRKSQNYLTAYSGRQRNHLRQRLPDIQQRDPVQSFLPIFGFGPRKRPKKVYLTSSPNCHQFHNSSHACFPVAHQCQLIRKLDRGEQTCLPSPPHCHLGGRAFGPPLCRGCAPATPPYKTIAHPPSVLIPTVPLQQRGRRQPNTQSDCLSGGSD